MGRRRFWTAAAAVTCAGALACAGATRAPARRSTQHCGLMNDRELRRPIEGQSVKLYDSGGFVRLQMVVEAILDDKGYVKQARVAWADPPGVFDRTVLESVEKWRYCPQLAWRLAGTPVTIPVDVAFDHGDTRSD